jgi:hypothetical protein
MWIGRFRFVDFRHYRQDQSLLPSVPSTARCGAFNAEKLKRERAMPFVMRVGQGQELMVN